LFWFFCGEAAKKPKQKHFSGVCNPQSPALQSGKPLNFMRMGTRFPHTPHSGGVWGFLDEVEKTPNPKPHCKAVGTRPCAFFAVRKQHIKQVKPVENPTVKSWHAVACVFRFAQAVVHRR
jgi:hypothetical protein